jgi:hypothetical protein
MKVTIFIPSGTILATNVRAKQNASEGRMRLVGPEPLRQGEETSWCREDRHDIPRPRFVFNACI